MAALAYFCLAMQKPPGRSRRGPSRSATKRGNGQSTHQGKPFKPGRKPGGTPSRPFVKKTPVPADPNGPIRLNRYIANAGVCSRREADVLIGTGAVRVNGEVVTEMGLRVSPSDHVQVGDHRIKPETKRYILVNKPKGFAATPIDPTGKRTVGDLVAKVCREMLHPVGKMEPESSGLVLMTNDLDLMQRMTHLVTGTKQLFHVELKTKVNPEHLEALLTGVSVDGKITRAEAASVDEKNPFAVGLEIRSQRSRIARRLMEQLGYTVMKVDRVKMGPLTKKDLPRGHVRELKPEELNLLRMS